MKRSRVGEEQLAYARRPGETAGDATLSGPGAVRPAWARMPSVAEPAVPSDAGAGRGLRA